MRSLKLYLKNYNRFARSISSIRKCAISNALVERASSVLNEIEQKHEGVKRKVVTDIGKRSNSQ